MHRIILNLYNFWVNRFNIDLLSGLFKKRCAYSGRYTDVSFPHWVVLLKSFLLKSNAWRYIISLFETPYSDCVNCHSFTKFPRQQMTCNYASKWRKIAAANDVKLRQQMTRNYGILRSDLYIQFWSWIMQNGSEKIIKTYSRKVKVA